MANCFETFIESNCFLFPLLSLKLNSGIDFDPNCKLDLDALDGNEAYYLLLVLAQFDEIIEQSCFLLEPRSIMDYLFQLK